MDVRTGRLALTDAETAQLEELIADRGDDVLSFTRRDAGNTGPVVVHLAGDEERELDFDGLPAPDTALVLLNDLVAARGDEIVSYTRRDPGNKGPILVHLNSGEELELA